MNPLTPSQLWHFLPRGYLLSIAVETPVLLIGLSRRHGLGRRLFAGVWLTACSYPIVVLVMPILFASSSYGLYLLVAETFAPVSECALFAAAFYRRGDPSGARRIQDMIVIILANLASFGFGVLAELMHWKWVQGSM
ncbi:MAG TPA: hypothetical protein VFE47_20090 [Tepidisphaeraceae bacterium]|jgi:hypothetical protein|nr:hypothetical protein [Tepidisphaeraceae bacterium]